MNFAWAKTELQSSENKKIKTLKLAVYRQKQILLSLNLDNLKEIREVVDVCLIQADFFLEIQPQNP